MLQRAIVANTSGQTAAWMRLYSAMASGFSPRHCPTRCMTNPSMSADGAPALGPMVIALARSELKPTEEQLSWGDADGPNRARRGGDGRPKAEGEADGRDPVLRQPGDTDRPRHRFGWRGRHRLFLYHRHWWPLGDEAHRAEPRAGAAGARGGHGGGHLARPPLPRPCDQRRPHPLDRARGDRHGAVGPALP